MGAFRAESGLGSLSL